MPIEPSAGDVETSLNGRYQQLQRLGIQGGQGVLFRAIGADGAVVALKLYHVDQIQERSEREVDALAQLRGETIVKLHAAGSITIGPNEFRYLATTFIEGESLAAVIARGPVASDAAARVAIDVALALDELWSLTIVHRDVKPPNIMVRPDGRAVLIDLGIARQLDRDALTAPGIAWGTLGYYAPEQLQHRNTTCKADVFALGIVMQEMLLGHHPTGRRQELLMAGGPSISILNPDTPAQLAQTVDRMVNRQPHLRPSPRQVILALENFLNSTPEGTR